MSTANTRLRAARASSLFALNETRARLRQGTALMCGALLAPAVFAADAPDDTAREIAPTVITAIAPARH